MACARILAAKGAKVMAKWTDLSFPFPCLLVLSRSTFRALVSVTALRSAHFGTQGTYHLSSRRVCANWCGVAKFPNPFSAIILMVGSEMVPPMMVMLWKILMVAEIGHLVMTKRCFSVLNEAMIVVSVAMEPVMASMASRLEFLASTWGSASMKSFQVEGA